jgi:GNAT superfamily N-acetyltransferase
VTTSPSIVFDALTHQDLGGALRLSTQAGWNQIEADWKRLIDHSPGGCIAARSDGSLIATATLMSYGTEAHWIGMVIVDEAYRGRGLGTEVLTRAIQVGRDQGSQAIGLDATHLGRPVYLKNGLVDVAPIERWAGFLKERDPQDPVSLIDHWSFDRVTQYDRRSCGVDRSSLIVHLVLERDVLGLLVDRGGSPAGFAILRPGRAHCHLGPVVADDPGVLDSLLAAAAHHLHGQDVVVDLFPEPENVQAAQRAGLVLQRQLTRMTVGSPQRLLMGPRVRAGTSFEWG